MRHPCPCCSYLTLTEKPPGTSSVCPVCCWEDDDAQFRDTTLAGGANAVSLDQARKNFAMFGASTSEARRFVRAPLKTEHPKTESA